MPGVLSSELIFRFHLDSSMRSNSVVHIWNDNGFAKVRFDDDWFTAHAVFISNISFELKEFFVSLLLNHFTSGYSESVRQLTSRWNYNSWSAIAAVPKPVEGFLWVFSSWIIWKRLSCTTQHSKMMENKVSLMMLFCLFMWFNVFKIWGILFLIHRPQIMMNMIYLVY